MIKPSISHSPNALPDTLTAGRYVAHIAQLLEDNGHCGLAMLDQMHLTMSDLNRSRSYVTLTQLDQIINFSERHLGEDQAPWLLAKRLNLTSHGDLGFAAMTAKDARQAIDTAVSYIPLVTALFRLQKQENEKHATIWIDPHPGQPFRVELFVIKTLLGSLDLIGDFLLGQYKPDMKIDLAMEEKENIRQHLGSVFTEIRFNQPRSGIHMKAGVLDIPFPLSDPQAHEMAIKRCQRRLDSLNNQQTLSSRLQGLFLRHEHLPLSIEDVAKQFNMSSRTIHRRLEQEGTNYRHLMNSAILSRGQWMLIREGKSITETAYLLGYQDPANFTRAFKRHLGITPSQFKKNAKVKTG